MSLEYKVDITQKIIGAAFQVHTKLGNGFQEVIYQRALAIEFERVGLDFEREKDMDIFYDDVQIGTRRVDFMVDGDIPVEIKALIKFEPVHFAQAINYIEAYHCKIGLLLNFGAEKLEMKRFWNKNNPE